MREQLSGISHFLPPHGSWELNSDPRAWWQAAPPPRCSVSLTPFKLIWGKVIVCNIFANLASGWHWNFFRFGVGSPIDLKFLQLLSLYNNHYGGRYTIKNAFPDSETIIHKKKYIWNAATWDWANGIPLSQRSPQLPLESSCLGHKELCSGNHSWAQRRSFNA